jgi:hypothetical protein
MDYLDNAPNSIYAVFLTDKAIEGLLTRYGVRSAVVTTISYEIVVVV